MILYALFLCSLHGCRPAYAQVFHSQQDCEAVRQRKTYNGLDYRCVVVRHAYQYDAVEPVNPPPWF